MANRLIIGFTLVLATAVAITAQAPKNGTASDQAEAALLRDGKAATAIACSDCHDLDDVFTARKTQRQWDETVRDMVTRGAEGTPAQFALITRYLTRIYGVVAINTAPAAEISAVLGLSAQDASAVVEYRKANGAFADRAALSKVTGIDQAKIDEQPEALNFKK